MDWKKTKKHTEPMQEPTEAHKSPQGSDTANSAAPENILIERMFATVGEFQISYQTSGSGFPVLLIHGLGASSVTWKQTIKALAPQFCVFAPDMPGCGESDAPETEYSIEFLTQSMLKFMDAVGIQKAHVVGHSLGGGVALGIHQRQPERIEKLALVSSAGLGKAMHWLLRMCSLPGAPKIITFLSSPQSLAPQASRAFEQRRMRRLRAEYDPAAPTVLEKLRSPEIRRAFLRMLRESSGINGQRVSATPYIMNIQNPVLIVWGAKDQTIPVLHGIAAATLIPNAHLEIIPKCYHRPPVESPSEFNSILENFLLAEVWPPESAGNEEERKSRAKRLLRAKTIRRRIGQIATPAAIVLAGAVSAFLGAGIRKIGKSAK